MQLLICESLHLGSAEASGKGRGGRDHIHPTAASLERIPGRFAVCEALGASKRFFLTVQLGKV